MQAIKWSGDISKAVVKDYLISIKTRVGKLRRYVDPANNPTWEYSNPVVTANGVDLDILANRLAEEEYPGAAISSVTATYSESFDWGNFLTRHYRAKQSLGYNHPSTLDSPLDAHEMLPWNKFTNSSVPGIYAGGLGSGFGISGYINNYGNYFTVIIHTIETVKTYHPGYYTTDNSTTPPTQVWHPGYYTYASFNHDVSCNTVYQDDGSTEPIYSPGVFTPVTEHGYSPGYLDHFDDPAYPLLEFSTTYNDGLTWLYPHVEVTINFSNGKSTRTWYDMEKWNAEAGLQPIDKTTLLDTALPFIPIRLNKLNITDPSLSNNTIAKSIKKACRKLQMKPKTILNSIKHQGGMPLAQVEAQIDGEIADEAELNQDDSSYVPPTAAERQQRIDDLSDQEQEDALIDKNDIFIAFLTSLATENVWEKELLYWTFHRYYSDASLTLVKAPGNVYEIEVSIPDLYFRFSYSKIELTTATTYPSNLTEDKYELEIIYQLVHEPLFGTGTVEDTFYVYRGYDQIRLWYMDDSGVVTQMDVYKFSTSLGTPKDLETWDGTLPTDTDDYYWALNTIGDKTGDDKDIAANKHCIPIHIEVLESRTTALATDSKAVKVHKLKTLKRCYEYGSSFIIVELKKIHVPWWVSWVKAIAFIWTVTLQIFAIVNIWNPVGWTVQAFISFVETQVINYVVNEIVGAVVKELVKLLPVEVAALIVIAVSLLSSGISGDFDNLNNVELALEIVDVTSSGMNLVLSEESRQLAKSDSALNDKIKKLEQDLEDARDFLESLDPNSNKTKEGSAWNQYNDKTDPYQYIHEQRYYGDTSAMYETPDQFFERTIRTINPGVVAINSSSLTTAMLLDPTSNIDLGII